jgi:hypothetical protein
MNENNDIDSSDKQIDNSHGIDVLSGHNSNDNMMK